MAQGICGRTAAALTMIVFGLPPAFAMDRVANDRVANDRVANKWDAVGTLGVALNTGLDRDAAATQPCPTRFDYVVLASYADASSLLSLSTYRFRSGARFGTVPLDGLQRVDYPVESAAGNCGPRAIDRQTT
jgi:hypothetical protein